MKKHLQKVLVFFLLFSLGKPLSGQDQLVDYTFLATKTKIELFFLFGQAVDYDVNLYKIRYKTYDVHGLLDTASGLLVLPLVPGGTLLPIVVYAHGTTNGPMDVPSQQRGGYQVAMAYAAYGFATIAPDYLGLGDVIPMYMRLLKARPPWIC
jgi:dipeptidyl aminopeptidase/acylaminoacyl peptidase